MKTFRCHCGNTLHFENTHCLSCGRTVGFVPELLKMSSFEETKDGNWRAMQPAIAGQDFRKCNNYKNANVCNWMVPCADPVLFCRSCRLNHMIPNLSDQKNIRLWQRIERAKRRLIYTLLDLGLPLIGREFDAVRGLAFEFLEDQSNEEFRDDLGHHQRVMTGHRTGLITVNIAEADSSQREEMREKLGEGYRTLLGHFRHEVGHYYWDRLVAVSDWLVTFRKVFADERADYAAALNSYYANGAPSGWQTNYISAYATLHPWEDWAETWAHYLHMVDTLDTAYDMGFVSEGGNVQRSMTSGDSRAQLTSSVMLRMRAFDEILSDWMHLTVVLNALNRSMGLRDAYPFVLTPAVAEKLHFVHRVITSSVAAG